MDFLGIPGRDIPKKISLIDQIADLVTKKTDLYEKTLFSDMITTIFSTRKELTKEQREAFLAVLKKLQNKKDLLNLIAEEINVKEITFGDEIAGEVELDTNITPTLKKEGDYREILRRVQELRKEKGLQPGQLATLATSAQIATTGLLQEFETDLKRIASLEKINHGVLADSDFELR